MRAGQLRHRVIIQQDIGTTRDDSGQPIENWQSYAERWASVKPLEGRELWTSQQRWPEVDSEIEMRGDLITELISPKMRVLFGSVLYNILAVVNQEERGIEILLKCQKEG